MDLLDRHGAKATVSACGRAVQRLPALAADAARRGHEVSAHGWRWESHAGMEEAMERQRIAWTVAAIEAATGTRPVGWHTRSAASQNTRRLLVEEGGFLYDSDAYNDDLPYRITVGGRQHLVLPYAFDTNDMHFQGTHRFAGGDDFATYVEAALDWLHREGASGAQHDVRRPASAHDRPAWTHRRARPHPAPRRRPGRVWIARRCDIARLGSTPCRLSRLVLIVNPNTSMAVTGLLGAEGRRVAAGRCEVLAVSAPSGLDVIATPNDIAAAGQAVVETLARHPDAAAVIIAAFGDPGLEMARAISSRPVIGLGEAGLAAAGRGGRTFSVVTVGRAMERAIHAKVARLGLAAQMASVRFLECSIAALIADPTAQVPSIMSAIAASIAADGVQAILLGGAPFAGLANALDAPPGLVIDGIAASIEGALASIAR